MMLLRGKGHALEIGCADRDVAAVCDELRERLAESPDFYRGSRAKAVFGPALPSGAEVDRLREVLAEFGIVLDSVAGESPLAEIAEGLGLTYAGPAALREAPAQRPRPAREAQLSEAARSLVADFAGARTDLAARRLGRSKPVAAPSVKPAPPASVPIGPSTLYHRGTLRGGQALHHLGNVVVVGDVNPGAEIVASGDILVFGALRGVAHAGAQGDAAARVVALELAPTQLRIATVIAVDGESGPDGVRPRGPEHALIREGQIIIAPHDGAELAPQEVVN
jgi:septum site-determining protein MinC